jgi:hypothetical protein
MSDELAQIKGDEEILRQAYRAAGGKELDRGHNSCLWCSSHDALSRFETNGRWQYKCQSCGTAGTVVDVVMIEKKCNLKDSIRIVLETYGHGLSQRRKDAKNGEEKKEGKKESKTHRDPDSAFEAALWFMRQREPAAVFVRKWVYLRANCEPFGHVARFDIPRVDEDGAAYKDKEFRPIVFVSAGWKLTAKSPKGEKWPIYGLNRIQKVLTAETAKKI